MANRQLRSPVAKKVLDVVRAGFFGAMARTRHTRLEALVHGVHDMAVRSLRLVVDPVPHPELETARAVFSGARLARGGATRALVLSQRAWPSHTAFDTTVAAALSLRDVDVTLLTCGGDLPACQIARPRREVPKTCHGCAGYQSDYLELLGLPLLRMRELVTAAERSAAVRATRDVVDPSAFKHEGLPLGEWIKPAVAWRLRDSQIRQDRRDLGTYRDLLAGAIIAARAIVRALDRVQPDVVFALSGAFLEERILRGIAETRGIRVVTYEVGTRANTWIVTEGAASAYDLDHLWAEVSEVPLTPAQETELDALLAAREHGMGIDPSLWRHRGADEVRRFLGVPEEGRLFTIFGNVGWDTAAFGRAEAFDDDTAYVEHFLDIAAEVGPEGGTFVVRVHPAEVALRSRSPLDVALASRDLPSNVRVIGADAPVSSYALMDASDAVVVYTSTVGIEAALRGRPVIVGARTHYRGKGFTRDIRDPQELREWLTGPLPAVAPEQVPLARRYAHLFFVTAFTPFPPVALDGGTTNLTYGSVDELRLGRDPFLDAICDEIAGGR